MGKGNKKEIFKARNLYHVRFSNKVYFGYGLQNKLHIVCKPSEQYCLDCIQKDKKLNKKDKKRHHYWAAVGYNFRSDINFYEVPGNTNRKMSQKFYIDQILELIVKPWVNAYHDFVLEKDGDSGYGPGKSNIVHT